MRRAPTLPPPTLRSDRGGAIALMTALMAPALLLMLGLTVDGGFWILGSTQLQIAADAAAMGAGQLLTSSLKSQSTANQNANLVAAATFEAQRAATKLAGTMNAPTATSGNNFTTVSVVITSQAPGFFYQVAKLIPPFTGVTPPLLRATATVTIKGGPIPCVLTLGTAGDTIEVNGSGVVSASSCPIYSNSNGTPAIHAAGSGKISEAGYISGSEIGAVGTITFDNGGSVTAGTITQNGKSAQDPFLNTPTPTAGTCTTGQSDFSSGGYAYPPINPQTWCNTSVNVSNNASIQFRPGTYYITNGNLTFSNATVTLAAGVSFVLTGTNPGNFNWTNNSSNTNPVSAPASTPFAIFQGCRADGGAQSMVFNGGSTLNVTGEIYAPCSDVNISNNAQVNGALGQQFGLVSKSLTVIGSAGLKTAAGSGASGGGIAGPVLTQ